MKRTTITAINEVRKNGIVLVSLSGMRADLTDCMHIDTNEIESWFGVDEDGYSVAYSIRPGQAIEYDDVSEVTRKIFGVRFAN